MNELTEQRIDCPYCGEPISILVDTSVLQQQYIEDCEVCCRPIEFEISVGASGGVDVIARSDNDA